MDDDYDEDEEEECDHEIEAIGFCFACIKCGQIDE